MIYFKLFIIFFKISLFSFSGIIGISLIQYEIVENYTWMSYDDFFNLLSLIQLVPGNISANLAFSVGFYKAGLLGGFSAFIGFCFFPFIFVLFLYRFLSQKWKNNKFIKALFFGLLPTTIVYILYTIFVLLEVSLILPQTNQLNWIACSIFLLAVFVQYFFKLSNFSIIVLCIILSIYFM